MPRREEERAAKLSEQMARAAEEENARLEQFRRDQEESFKRNLEMLQQKMLEEKQNLIAENEKLLQQKMQEYERAVKDELDKVVQSREQEIKELREQIERDNIERSKIQQAGDDGFPFTQVLKNLGSFFIEGVQKVGKSVIEAFTDVATGKLVDKIKGKKGTSNTTDDLKKNP